ncbi:OsmC family protein [Leeia sp. TBRC 13508]|uniref:OsmC family protein n=1 Tax=Leeia speluncae TaxID=2884804 RepID=A0ABS8D6V5_9NEIS|nr:OsmC family protein [Leeia speluncae]MCB6183930.1 OsmC family protein [Leeia speluncae]
MPVIVKKGNGTFQQHIQIDNHSLVADVPVNLGGDDQGPQPHDLLAAALGSCTAMTIVMYAKRKEMALDDVEVSVSQTMIAGTHLFTRHIHYIGNLNAEEKARLTEIANKCPVHKTLTSTIQVVTDFS